MILRQRRRSQKDKDGLGSKKHVFMDSNEWRCLNLEALNIKLVESEEREFELCLCFYLSSSSVSTSKVSKPIA